MAQGVGIEEVIDINTSIVSGGIAPADYGTGLLFTDDVGGSGKTKKRLSLSGEKQIQKFTSIGEVNDFFSVTSKTYKDAEVWFSAEPPPKSLYIAKVTRLDTATKIFTGEISQTVINSMLGTGSVKFGFKLGSTDIKWEKGGNASTGLSGVLQRIKQGLTNQTLNPDLSPYKGIQVALDSTGKRLVFTLSAADPVDSSNPITTDMPIIGAPENDTNVADDFFGDFPNNLPGYDEGNGQAYYFIGTKKEDDLKEVLNNVGGYASGGTPTALMLGSNLIDGADFGASDPKLNLSDAANQKDSNYIAAFVESNVFETQGSVAASAAIEDIFAKNHKKTIGIYSETPTESNKRIDIAVLAKLSSQNFNEADSIITVVPKPLDGVVTSSITKNNIDGLEKVNASVYTKVGGYDSFLGGKTANGNWIDAQWWLGWLKNEMELNIFNAIRASKRLKNIELTDTIHRVMAKAIRTGGIQLGGQLNTTLTNEVRRKMDNPGFDGILQNGYVLWIQKTQNATDIDRNSRHSQFTVWISPSEAIHSVSGGIVLSG